VSTCLQDDVHRWRSDVPALNRSRNPLITAELPLNRKIPSSRSAPLASRYRIHRNTTAGNPATAAISTLSCSGTPKTGRIGTIGAAAEYRNISTHLTLFTPLGLTSLIESPKPRFDFTFSIGWLFGWVFCTKHEPLWDDHAAIRGRDLSAIYTLDLAL
jgi:hypothetical protein